MLYIIDKSSFIYFIYSSEHLLVKWKLLSHVWLWPHGLYSPWNSPGQNTGVGSLSLLQGIFSTQGSNQASRIAGGFFTSWATGEVHLVKAMVFVVVMYGCEGWTIEKAECQRIYAFELWCWTRPLRVPWTARQSKQSTLKEISPEYSLEGLMLKLKLLYFGHLMQRNDSLENTLMLGKDWRQEEKGITEDEMVGWLHRLNGHESEQAPGVGDGQRSLACCLPRGCKESDMTELTELNWMLISYSLLIPLPTCPLVTISLFSTWVCFCLVSKFMCTIS